MSRSIWATLGIRATTDRTAIRRAYAKRLKTTNPEDDAEKFQTLRAAYEAALDRARYADLDEDDEVEIVADDAMVEITADPALLGKPAPLEPVEPSKPDVLEHLAMLLTQVESVTADELMAAFKAVIDHPDMERLEVRRDHEDRLAWLIAYNSPRSDPLIEPAIERFNWSDRHINNLYGSVPTVIERKDGLGYLKRIRHPESDEFPAYRALTAPPKPYGIKERLLDPFLSGHVERLLTDISRYHPGVTGDLNPQSLETWQGFLNRPRLPNWGLWLMVLSVPALILSLWGQMSDSPVVRSLTGLLLMIPMAAVVPVLIFYLYKLPKHRWGASDQFNEAPSLLRVGFWPLSLLIPFIAALSAYWPGVPILIASGALSLGVIIWAMITGAPDKSEHDLHWGLRLLLSEFFLMVWWGVIMWGFGGIQGLSMTAALIAATLASGYGRFPMYEVFARVTPLLQTAYYGLIAVFAAMSLWLLWASPDQPYLGLWAVAAVAATSLMMRVPLPMLNSGNYVLFVRIIAAAAIFGRHLVPANYLLAAGGTALILLLGFRAFDLYRFRHGDTAED